MGECCCVLYRVNLTETQASEAIDTNNLDFFNSRVRDNQQHSLLKIKIIEQYSIF